MSKQKESIWEQMQKVAVRIFAEPLERKQSEEISQISIRYAKAFNRKNAKLAGPMKILQKRTLGTAIQVIENVYDIPFEKLATANYLFCQDIKTEKFTRLYEAQIDLAGMAPDDFVKGLHKFFNNAARMIKEEGLQQEFAEFLSLTSLVANEIRAKEGMSERGKVSTAYVCLLLQQTQYLRQDKFDFSTNICGLSSSGEYLEIPDIYPLMDTYSDEAEEKALKMMERGESVDPIALVVEAYAKHGIEITCMADLEQIQNIDKLFVSNIGVMMPYISEYTYDILPQPDEAFQCAPLPYYCIKFAGEYGIETLHGMLKKRARTLPTNGARIAIKGSEGDHFIWKDILMKETFHSDGIVMLYKLNTVTGCLSGYYNTKNQEFYSPLQMGVEVDETLNDILERLVLFLYACAVTRRGPEMLKDISQHTFFECENAFRENSFEAEILNMGGKLRNVYDKETTRRGPTGPRAGNEEKYEAKTSAIQGFIRKVGEGRTPSPEAVERAEMLGFDLAPDETYVQPFVRTTWKLKRQPLDGKEK